MRVYLIRKLTATQLLQQNLLLLHRDASHMDCANVRTNAMIWHELEVPAVTPYMLSFEPMDGLPVILILIRDS